jgi:hypothetical protein
VDILVDSLQVTGRDLGAERGEDLGHQNGETFLHGFQMLYHQQDRSTRDWSSEKKTSVSDGFSSNHGVLDIKHRCIIPNIGVFTTFF